MKNKQRELERLNREQEAKQMQSRMQEQQALQSMMRDQEKALKGQLHQLNIR